MICHMNHSVQTQLLKDVPPTLYADMYALNHGMIGMMRRTLAGFRASGCPFTRVFYVMNGAALLGWALVFPKEFEDGSDIPIKYEIHFYVHHSKRGIGIGSALAKELRVFYNNKKIGGHTEYSTIMHRHAIPSVHSL